MARNIVSSGTPLLVWNRSEDKVKLLVDEGAKAASSPEEVFENSSVIFLMLRNGDIIDNILHRSTEKFEALLQGRTLVHLGTTSPEYSAALERDVHNAGGQYAEVPVSGSRDPAEAGALVGMMAGNEDTLASIKPLIEKMCSATIPCGDVPKATLMKLAVNTFLAGQVTALMEATNLAARGGLDLNTFSAVLWDGPISSDLMRMKLPKLINKDYSPQASLLNALDNLNLIKSAAESVSASIPIIDVCRELFTECSKMGYLDEDMSAVIEVYAKQSIN